MIGNLNENESAAILCWVSIFTSLTLPLKALKARRLMHMLLAPDRWTLSASLTNSRIGALVS